ncbi:MAG: hypothetical protein QW331_02060 [Candidatus Woesearchaeota archaeon]
MIKYLAKTVAYGLRLGDEVSSMLEHVEFREKVFNSTQSTGLNQEDDYVFAFVGSLHPTDIERIMKRR